MRKIYSFFIVICLFVAGCEKDGREKDDLNVKDGFWLKMGDNSIVYTSDIDFYDMSTHIIYLKKKIPYLKRGTEQGVMSMYVDDVEIYKCGFHPQYLSYLPKGTYISSPLPKEEDIIRIRFLQMWDSNHEPTVTDPRSDERIIAALKKNNQYHEGLHCELQSVHISNGEAILDIALSNPDTFDYYYLDPDKMGIGLFHYFTNGLYIYTKSFDKSYTHRETVTHPEPWDLWKKEWLTLIKSGERKNISIAYPHFDDVPAGNYMISFEFPGLNYGITPKDLILKDGRIWMGSIYTEKEIVVE